MIHPVLDRSLLAVRVRAVRSDVGGRERRRGVVRTTINTIFSTVNRQTGELRLLKKDESSTFIPYFPDYRSHSIISRTPNSNRQ